MRTTFAILPLFALALGAPTGELDARGANLATSTTQNDLTGNTGCKAMTVIFARGTTETGNVGTLSGPPFFSALSSKVGASNLAVQGVQYPADIPGFLAGGDATGSATMAKLVKQAMTTCPDTKVVMSGYSQGGQLVHNAAKMLDATTSAKVNSGKSFTSSRKPKPSNDKDRDTDGWFFLQLSSSVTQTTAVPSVASQLPRPRSSAILATTSASTVTLSSRLILL
jgi:hypothetical protein